MKRIEIYLGSVIRDRAFESKAKRTKHIYGLIYGALSEAGVKKDIKEGGLGDYFFVDDDDESLKSVAAINGIRGFSAKAVDLQD